MQPEYNVSATIAIDCKKNSLYERFIAIPQLRDFYANKLSAMKAADCPRITIYYTHTHARRQTKPQRARKRFTFNRQKRVLLTLPHFYSADRIDYITSLHLHSSLYPARGPKQRQPRSTRLPRAGPFTAKFNDHAALKAPRTP